MPLYEYQCTACGVRTEVLQRAGAAPLAACPHCGGPVEKLLSPPALQFKGSGFYITDYARGNGRGSNGSSEGKGGSESGSGEAKPASSSAASADKTTSE